MEHVKRAGRVLAIFCFTNLLLVFGVLLPLNGWLTVLAVAGLAVFYIRFNFRPRSAKGAPRRLRVLLGGYELLLVAFLDILASMAFYIALYRCGALRQSIEVYSAPAWVPLVVNALVFVPLMFILLLNGFFRVLLACNRLRIVWRALLLLCWWVPVFNLYLFCRVLRAAKSEYRFELSRLECEAAHAENEDCKTRYPIVLVHGIFFRDWQHINYWGRIPRALQKCGADIYYGGQQSAAPVARSASELCAGVRAVLEKTGADKVNLIAHSKGGLDSRFAISRLGLAGQVASLTTINTPHRGCIFAGQLLQTLPRGVVRWMERRYNAVFRRLGDDAPDFLGGVTDLTADACAVFNQTAPDAEGVYYQSVMSTMRSPKSAGFPLNLTWRLVNKYDREENDGLVSRSSAEWGHFLGNVTAPGRRGVSHGDVIDLLREDIDGFPVREFYIELVKGLKDKGF